MSPREAFGSRADVEGFVDFVDFFARGALVGMAFVVGIAGR
jgi:hypothetical protein